MVNAAFVPRVQENPFGYSISVIATCGGCSEMDIVLLEIEIARLQVAHSVIAFRPIPFLLFEQ